MHSEALKKAYYQEKKNTFSKIDIPHILSQGTKVVYLILVSFLNCGYTHNFDREILV